MLNPNRLFPADAAVRGIATELYESVRNLSIISPHGHTDPRWFAENQPFPDPTTLFVEPDHYLFRMLYSQGISLDALGIPRADGSRTREVDPRDAWELFASHYYLFRGTPSRLWLDYAFAELFDLDGTLCAANAQEYYDAIARKLAEPGFRPRALYERFRLEVLATTDAATDTLEHHQATRQSGWKGRLLPTFRPDAVINPAARNFRANLESLGALTGCDVLTYSGYLDALRSRRRFFLDNGATATDHGHQSAATADLDEAEASSLYERILRGRPNPGDAELFEAQMLTEMAGMSIEDGLVMQLHPGAVRNHNPWLLAQYGPDMGADIPGPTDYVRGLKPLLGKYGNDARLTLVLFTLDESTFSRELAPLAGHYPSLKLGPPWWFLDSPEALMRFRRLTTETAGFYNTVGFNDDTRAFFSIPGRHDVARRVDCSFLAQLVAEHQIALSEAFELAQELTVGLVRRGYKL